MRAHPSMSSLIFKIILFLSIRYGLCAFKPEVLQASRQSGSSLSDIVERKIGSEHIISDNEKTSKEGSSAYNRGESGSNEQKQDRKIYGDQDTARKEYDKGRHSLGESEAVDQGKNSFQQHGNRYYKKGHHRTGFSNNYHKDESGNNSSFYEDNDDEQGHRSSENNGGYYGLKSQDSFRDLIRDASLNERDRAQQGLYDNRANYDNYRSYSGGRDNNRYNDDRKNYLRDEMGRYFDRSGKDIYYRRGQFYPVIDRDKDYTPSFRYSHYYTETLPRDYRKENPDAHFRDFRYFPSRDNNYDRDIYYPDKGYYDRKFFDDTYDNEYYKYRKGFDNGYGRY